MKKKFYLLLVCFALLAGTFLPQGKGIAANGTITIAENSVNVRKGPGLSYQQVKQVNKGEKYTVVTEQGDWIEIELSSGKTGWVANWLVTKSSNGSQKISSNSKPSHATANTDQLRVRSGPGTSFRIIGYLDKGQAVNFLEENENWAKISADFGEGWVAREYINVNTESNTKALEETKETDKGVVIELLNVRTEPSTTGTVIGKLDKDTAVTIYSKKKDWLQIKFADQKAWVSAEFVQVGEESTQKTDKSSGKMATVTASTLTVRSDGSENSTIIGSVSQGESYEILDEVNNWVKIEYQPGKYGWAAGWYFSQKKEKASSSVKESTITVLHDGSNIRNSPSVSSDVLVRAEEGETYPVKSIQDDWYEISLSNGKTGFIAGWIVTANGSSEQINKQGSGGNLKNKTIVIDPGHGGIDDGATGVSGTLEKDLTLRTARLLFDKLKAAGANVLLTRSNDSYVPLPSRVRAASTEGADAFISLHYDSNLDRNVRGMTAYYYHSYQKELATYVYKATNAQTRLKSRGVRSGDFHVVRENQQKAVLMELGYLSNPSEELTLKSGQFQENAATGLYNGLARFFKEN